MRFLALFFAVMFILFAIVQYNDPDPAFWMAIYGYAALVSLMFFLRRFSLQATALGAIAYFILAIYYFPSNVGDWIHAEEQAKSLQMTLPFQEEARESIGLFICFIVMALYIFFIGMLRKREEHHHDHEH
jgi:hypothetical protein